MIWIKDSWCQPILNGVNLKYTSIIHFKLRKFKEDVDNFVLFMRYYSGNRKRLNFQICLVFQPLYTLIYIASFIFAFISLNL